MYTFEPKNISIIGYTKDITTLEKRIEALKSVKTPEIQPLEKYVLVEAGIDMPGLTPSEFIEKLTSTKPEELSIKKGKAAVIVGSVNLSGTWNKAGHRRLSQDQKGHEAMEEVLSITSNEIEYVYFHFTQRGLMQHVYGRILINETDNGIHVKWEYRVLVKGFVSSLLCSLGKKMFLTVMETALEQWKEMFTKASSPRPNQLN